jgi:hypothetical protein
VFVVISSTSLFISRCNLLSDDLDQLSMAASDKENRCKSTELCRFLRRTGMTGAGLVVVRVGGENASILQRGVDLDGVALFAAPPRLVWIVMISMRGISARILDRRCGLLCIGR